MFYYIFNFLPNAINIVVFLERLGVAVSLSRRTEELRKPKELS
jgi:hypothetical protein